MSQQQMKPTQEDWMMGGSRDMRANTDTGITETEIAQIAIEAYYEAHMKAGVQRTLFVGELTRNFESLIAERFNVRVTRF